MYEPHHKQPLTRRLFALRLARHFVLAGAVMAASLLAGMIGYREFEDMSWLDAFVNASMLLGGMGPVKTDLTPHGKLFAGIYALYSGVVFIAVMGIMLAPVFHRVLHVFHWEDHHKS